MLQITKDLLVLGAMFLPLGFEVVGLYIGSVSLSPPDIVGRGAGTRRGSAAKGNPF